MMSSGTRSRGVANMPAPPEPTVSVGNLDSVLTSYDHSHNNNNNSDIKSPSPTISHQPYATGTLTINVPTGGSLAAAAADYQQQGHGSNSDIDRERSLTLGSEFDLGYVMGKDGRGMSISGLLTPLGEPEVMDHGTMVSDSTGQHSATQQQPAADGSDAPSNDTSRYLPGLPEHGTAQAIPTLRARGDSTASQFLNGICNHQPQSGRMIAHTPPTQMGTSYENSHFGKRMRAGSISGRLRSASDLEDTGMISREQKAILKDLIIAGDGSVQGAIDKYEAGDPSALEEMIRSGALLARSSDVDLLGDLDLDFLNMHGEEDGEMMFGNMDDAGAQGGQAGGGSDGIGDLEFNGDFSNTSAMEPKRVVGSQHLNKARGNSVDDLEVHRMRANSLALPGLLLDGTSPEESSLSFGRWMDKDVAGPLPPHPQPPAHHPMQAQAAAAQHQQYAPINVVGANGNQYLLNPTQYTSECDVLMTSKFRGPGGSTSETPIVTATSKTAKPRKDKKAKPKKEKPKKPPTAKKEKKEPRERKSQSKMKDMMESISSNKSNSAPSSKISPTAAARAGLHAAMEEEEENKEVPSGLGRPRSMSDPNLSVHLDNHGLLHVDGPQGWVGAYSPDSRQMRIERFLEKRNKRVWVKKVKYDVRKNFADSRLRVKGRFVKKEDEMLMRELMSLS